MKKISIARNDKNYLEKYNPYSVLNGPLEKAFERIARMAERMFSMPMVSVSFINDENKCFKVCLDNTILQIKRELTRFKIREENLLIISDIEQDELGFNETFKMSNSAVRFYLGCLLKLPDGTVFGELSLFDVKPRHFNSNDIGLLNDLVSMIESEAAALQIATIDDLTNICNRRGFFMLASKALDYCKRNGIQASLVFFDLNNFKQINDTFGHKEGDRVLTFFADCMSKNMRGSDIFARLGGDEFVALLINTSAEVASLKVSKLQKTIDRYNLHLKMGYQLSFSYGIPVFNPERHRKVEDLLEEGDCLMYGCKKKQKKT